MLSQSAVAELKAMQQPGTRLSPTTIIDRARSANSALHNYFTWDNDEAAHAFRLIQAKQVIKAVVRLVPNSPSVAARAIVLAPPPPPPPARVQVAGPISVDQTAVRRLMGQISELWPAYRSAVGLEQVFVEIRAVLDQRLRALPASTINNFGGAARESRGEFSRFKPYTHGEAHTDRDRAALPLDNPAMKEGRSLFPSRVFSAEHATGVLVAGHNNAKIGDFVTKGAWAGMNIFTLTLEERKTCPDTCHLWAECYGNAMPLARRWAYDEHLAEVICEEVTQKGREHPAGFVVRLHVLGDFVNQTYAEMWEALLHEVPQLHVFGYTAHAQQGDIGQVIEAMNQEYADRCAIRFSVSPDTDIGDGQATTIWRRDRGKQPEGLVCPASSGDTEACGTCGLCWNPYAWQQRIVFLGHGMNRGKKGPLGEDESEPPAPLLAPTKKPIVLSGEDRLATEIAERLTQMERKIFQHLDASGSPTSVSGPAMSAAIRLLWQNHDDSLINVTGPTASEKAHLTSLGRLVRGKVLSR